MTSPVELKDNSIILFTWELDFEMSPLQVVDFWGILSPTIFLILKGSVYQDFDTLASSCLLLLHFGDHVHLGYPILENPTKNTTHTSEKYILCNSETKSHVA